MYVKVKKSPRPYVVKPNKTKDFHIESLYIPESPEEYQRDSRHHHVNRLLANWRDEVYTRPTIAVRPNGKNVVVNGAHTIRALALKGAIVAPCEYFISKEDEKEANVYEAELFGRKNTTLTMSACDSFKAQVAMKEPNALKVNNAIKACGLYVEGLKPKGIKITTIKSCVDAYKRGGTGRKGALHLKNVLATLKKKWQGQEKCFHGGVIGGMSLFLNTYGRKVNMDTLEKSMGEYPPARLFYNEDGSIGPSSREVVVAKNIAKFYNRNCPQSRRLPLADFLKNKRKKKATTARKKKAV